MKYARSKMGIPNGVFRMREGCFLLDVFQFIKFFDSQERLFNVEA